MNLYRSLLWWLALAALGALGWTWFSQDLGDVVIRFRGLTYTTTLAYLVVGWVLLWFGLWAVWWLLGLPVRAWRRRARQLARSRLVSGLEALHQGRWQRAEALATRAAEDPALRTPALLVARRSAAARGDAEALARHQAALLAHDPATAALEQAGNLAEVGKPDEVLAVLAGAGALPPRGAVLQVHALVEVGRAHDALAALNILRREQALPAEALAELETRLTAALMAQGPQADALLQRWNAQPQRLQRTPAIAAAFATRAAQLGLEDHALLAVADALEGGWDESLAALYGRLPAGRGESRLGRAEGWLSAHPSSPALLVTLARLCAEQKLWRKAEDYLHRALAQGAGAEAWEALGDLWATQDDPARAQTAYANALRVGRGEAALALTGRTLRDQIAAQAVAEERNEHGLPRIP